MNRPRTAAPIWSCATLVALALQPRLHAASAETYAVDPARSHVAVHVGKSGLFRFAGHEHEVLATRFTGEVVAVPEDLGRSSVHLSFEASGLQVSEKGEPLGDAPKVQATMEGPRVLDLARFPTIGFASSGVSGKPLADGAWQVSVVGELKLHGTEARVSLPVRVELQGDELKASGQVALRQSVFGIDPVSVAGVVKVKDELTIDFTIVATKRP